MDQLDWQEEFRSFLLTEFTAMKERNAQISLRSFAKRAGVSPGYLSEILNGKKTLMISADRACEMIDALKLAPSLAMRMKVRIGFKPTLVQAQLPKDDFKIIRDWAYYAVLFSFDLPEPLRKIDKIAERTGIPLKRAKEILADLLKRNLLVERVNGVIQRAPGNLNTTDGPPDNDIRHSHSVSLKLAQSALVSIPSSHRDFTSYTFAANSKQLHFLTDEIRKLYARAATLMDGGESNDTVFRLSIQLYPIEFSSEPI